MLSSNLYEGRCRVCNLTVAPYTGWIMRTESGQRTKVYCTAHKPTTELVDPLAAEPDNKHPVDKDYEAWLDGEKPAATPAPAPYDQATLDAAVDKIAKVTADHFMAHVPDMVKQTLVGLVREVTIKVGAAPKVTVKQSHVLLPTILQAVSAGATPFLVGPAGSGKTTLAMQVAEVLKLKFYMAARVTSEFKLLGFIDATGHCVRTQFREAYEKGGVFLFDEVDASDPDPLTAFNAALSNGWCDFPDGMVARHKNFIAIAAGNTYGRGADRQYVGRNQLDAATLDRFQVFDVDYDEMLELALAGDAAWVKYVQSVRRAIDLEKVRHIVSPRASIQGAKMLASGMERKVVEDACIWKGLPTDQRQRVEFRMASTPMQRVA